MMIIQTKWKSSPPHPLPRIYTPRASQISIPFSKNSNEGRFFLNFLIKNNKSCENK